MHYVIGDVHGCFDELMTLLEKIEKEDKDAIFIFVGDFIDRGPKIYETITWAMEHISPEGKYQSVRGNHEQLAIDYIRQYEKWYFSNIEPDFVTEKGEPVSNYEIGRILKDSVRGTGLENRVHPRDYQTYLEFFESLPYHKLLEIDGGDGEKLSFRIVHAYYEHQDLPERQQQQSNLWSRIHHGNLESDEIIVHGHTPTFDIDYVWWDTRNTRPGMISYRKNDINVDGGAVYARYHFRYPCMLCAICLETLEEFYPWELEERMDMVLQNCALPYNARELARAYRENYLMRKLPHREEMLKRLGRKGKENIHD